MRDPDVKSNGAAPRQALVVGASRGIGRAVVEHLLRDPRVVRVVATARTGEGLRRIERQARTSNGRLQALPLDTTDDAQVQGLVSALPGMMQPPALVMHCAGLLHDGDLQPEKSLQQCRREHLLRSFEVNAIGPLLLARALENVFEPRATGTFAVLTAMVGSIGDNRLGGWYGYRASKAAAHQFLKTLSIEWRRRLPGMTVLALHPGTTDTQLSAPFQANVPDEKLYSPETSAARILEIIRHAGPGDSGRFFNWDGDPIPW